MGFAFCGTLLKAQMGWGVYLNRREGDLADVGAAVKPEDARHLVGRHLAAEGMRSSGAASAGRRLIQCSSRGMAKSNGRTWGIYRVTAHWPAIVYSSVDCHALDPAFCKSEMTHQMERRALLED